MSQFTRSIIERVERDNTGTKVQRKFRQTKCKFCIAYIWISIKADPIRRDQILRAFENTHIKYGCIK